MGTLLVALLTLLPQDDWPRRRAAFVKALNGQDAAALRGAVRDVAQADRVEAAELIVRAWLESERRARNAGEEHPVDLEAEHRLRAQIALAIGSFTDAIAIRWLASQMRDAASEDLREAIAAAAWRLGGPAMTEQVSLRVRGERSPVVLASALESARVLGLSDDRSAAVGHLAHAHWKVRRAAVRFVVAFDAAEAVRPLIDALLEEGLLREEVNDAIVLLTGVAKASDHAAWLEWWEAEGEKALQDRPPRSARLAAVEARRRAPGTQVLFYGIRVTSRRVIFVVDVLGSMEQRSAWRPEEDPSRPVGHRKMEVARFELKRCIDRLPPEARFNVVAFNSKLYVAADEMLTAVRESRKMAFEWIDAWKPEGGTDAWGALARGLEMAGVHRARLAADTIYFISDGKPSLGRPDWILAKVREKNPHAKVIVHAIAVGENADRAFMERLAEENGGSCYER